MRDIIFRAWDKEYETMVDNWDMFSFVGELMEFLKLMSVKQSEQDSSNYILMQWTGLEDKNGKQIFEGDIIKSPYIKTAGANNQGEVFWDESSAKFNIRGFSNGSNDCPWDAFWCNSDLEEMKVVGNIYENPELLEEQ